jgi:hypothetical protein
MPCALLKASLRARHEDRTGTVHFGSVAFMKSFFEPFVLLSGYLLPRFGHLADIQNLGYISKLVLVQLFFILLQGFSDPFSPS